MALNKFMHPKNPYKDRKPNFKDLAAKYELFREAATQDIRGNVHLDFKKPECLRALSWALLKEDFELDVEMPMDRLIPTVPLRLNYILWIEDLLTGNEHIRGIDIGCGASCIYPLLASKKNGWTMLATEADEFSFGFAQMNVKKNDLQGLVSVVKVDKDSLIADVVESSPTPFSFCMTNPPFFASNMEAWGMLSTRDEGKRAEPSSVSTASPMESIYPGGEVEFVKGLIADSLILKDKVRLYSSMLGKKCSLGPLKEELKSSGINNFGTTEFCQGKTMRWGLAWTFDSSITFPLPPSKQTKKVKPKAPLVFTLPKSVNIPYTLKDLSATMKSMLEDLKVKNLLTLSSATKHKYRMVAYQNTWSHQRRKKRQQMREAQNQPTETASNGKDIVLSDICTDGKNKAENNEHSAKPDQIVNEKRTLENDSENIGSVSKRQKLNDNDNQVKDDDQNQCESDNNTASDNKNSNDKVNISESQSQYESNKPNSPGDANASSSVQNQNEPIKSEGAKNSNETGTTTECLLCKCDVTLRLDKEDLNIEMEWIEGENKQSMYQILQYFRNKLMKTEGMNS